MPTRSALARLQQFTTLSGALAALAWFAWHVRTQPWVATIGAVLIFFAYSVVLAIEFVLLRHVVRNDPVPTPTAGQLFHAWWAETVDALKVFCWRQPFRWRAEPDFLGPGVQGRRGAVFIHGFVCNRGFWTPWLREMRACGHAFAAVNLEPVFGSIDDYAPIIDDAVRRVTEATGMPPVLVCHSMGGVAARAWLRTARAPERVHRVITIASPHHGTWLARFSHLTNGRQMRRHGEWLAQLAQDEAQRTLPPFTCWYSNCDNIVFPPSTAALPFADNHVVTGAAHVDLAFRPDVMRQALALVTG
ncbi:esterase/lipase family protein [Ramlibacter albus]|uniref:Alpha/beta fold hydrolase n=1 Tax=Ramlibacter albus TaxID=2079448 RepID=A0A923M3S6_9BURK|nr:alpha/beta fold hydrolase [Ramlibacter albus]MBC5763383.1 alpha/beta fold hydrolase [Ramlibacter albus]